MARETPAAASLPASHLERLASLASESDLKAFAIAAGRTLREMFPSAAVVVAHLARESREIRFDTVIGADKPRRVKTPADSGTPGRVLRKGAPVSFRAGHNDPKILAEAQALVGFAPRSILGWPLAAGASGHLGAVLFCDPGPEVRPDVLEGVAVPLLEASLASIWQTESARAEAGRLEALLDVSRQLLGADPRIADLRDRAAGWAQDPRPLLVLGEKGVGKRHLAGVLHASIPGSGRRLVEVACSKYPPEMVDAGLFEDWFGKGALLEQPILLYLHDALELPLATQRKLARALEPAFQPRGKGPEAHVVLGSTGDVRAGIAAGAAAAELFEPFADRVVVIPPLRERKDDVSLLADHFLREARRVHGKDVPGLGHASVRLLATQTWRENLLELRRVVDRAVRLARGDRIEPGLLARLLPDRGRGEDAGSATSRLDDSEVLAYLRSSRHRNWRTAIERLSGRFIPAAVPILVEKLGADEPIVRIEAAGLLARHGEGQARVRLIEHLGREDNRDVIVAALLAFAEVRAPEAAPACRAALASPDPTIRAAAVRASAALGGDEAVSALLERLDDESPRVRARAASALDRLGRAEFRKNLVKMLKDPDEETRLEAAQALAEVPDSVAVLLSTLETDPSIDVRIAVIASLGEVADAQAVRPLISRLSDPMLRFSCIEALGKLGAPEAIPALLDLVARETSSLFRRGAIQALARIGDPSVVPSIRPLVEVPTLAATVLETLCALGGSAAEETLLSLVRPDHPLLVEAVRGLGRVGTARAVAPLLDQIAGAPEYLARAIAESLGAIGPDAVEPLLASLADPARRPWVVLALGEIRDPRAAGPLLAWYDESEDVALAIERIGPAAIPSLLAVLPDRGVEVADFLLEFGEVSIPHVLPLLEVSDCAELAEELLVAFGEASAAPLLEAIDHVPDADVLARYLRILGRTGSREAFPRLLKHFVSSDPALRSAVIEGLGGIDNPMLVEGLVDALRSGDPRLAIQSLGSLARIRSAEAYEAVLEALPHPDPGVRQAALLAAWGFGGEARRRALAAALEDSEPFVPAGIADRALAEILVDAGRVHELVSDEAPPDERAGWIRLLGLAADPRADRILLELVDPGRPDDVRTAAVQALAGRDSRLLPALWPWLESTDEERRRIGEGVLAGLGLDTAGVGDLVRIYETAAPHRRRHLERHLAANLDDALPLLHEHLVASGRTEERFAVLALLEALQSPEPTP